MERWNIARNHVKFYNNVAVTATYNVPRILLQQFGSRGIEGLVYAALKENLSRQPILGVTIDDEGSTVPRWRRLSSIDLREIVNVVSADPNASADGWVQNSHRTLFPTTGELPLWRVVVAFQESALTEEGSHVSFAMGFFAHHAIADGLSCAAFHLTFLDALNSLVESPSAGPSDLNEVAMVNVPNLPLIPTLEMKAKLSISILFVLLEFIKAFIYNPIDSLNWSGPPVNADHPRPPIASTRSFSLTPAMVSKLIAKCRAEKTTITSLVTVLTARKLALMYPDHKSFTGTVPFSLRKFTGHSPKDMGVFVTNVTQTFSSEANPSTKHMSGAPSPKGKLPAAVADDEKLWDSARAFKRHLDENTASTHNQHVNMLKFVSDYGSYFLGLLGTKRAHAFEVTNIGIVDGGVGGEEGKATFDRVMFSAGGCAYGEPYVVFLATARNGYMNAAIGWQSVVVSDEEAKDLLGYLEREMRGLVEQ
ncbi:putative alcohol acetyltransferase FCK4 [Hyphodiscus hymeniophilus]|uniref:Alcohol acetyltransferase FCK4 n=1 Tax=Hyphodiscus hymeniophilus TaxID=353542 RepID=A0A9P6SPQ5_9HELO|nr:putative alcohol acetyltransferase FCK4 [Hyphodiscus hymeniophilus]